MAPLVSEATPVLNREKHFPPNFPATGSVHKGKNPFSIIIGIAIAVFLIAGIWRMISKPQDTENVQVVAAGKDIPPGCRITFTSLHYLVIPKRYLSSGMVASYADIVGKVSGTYIAMGEPITTADLLPAKGLSPTLNANQRAITIKLSEDEAVDHAMNPGDLVDVLATTTAANGKKYTKTICQNVPVLLTVPKDIVLSDKLRSNELNKITLAADPQDCETLAQAMEVSKLRLVLRGPTNRAHIVLPGADDRDLLPQSALHMQSATLSEKPLPPIPLPAPPPAPALSLLPLPIAAPPPPIQWMVDVFSGGKKESYAVPQK